MYLLKKEQYQKSRRKQETEYKMQQLRDQLINYSKNSPHQIEKINCSSCSVIQQKYSQSDMIAQQIASHEHYKTKYEQILMKIAKIVRQFLKGNNNHKASITIVNKTQKNILKIIQTIIIFEDMMKEQQQNHRNSMSNNKLSPLSLPLYSTTSKEELILVNVKCNCASEVYYKCLDMFMILMEEVFLRIINNNNAEGTMNQLLQSKELLYWCFFHFIGRSNQHDQQKFKSTTTPTTISGKQLKAQRLQTSGQKYEYLQYKQQIQNQTLISQATRPFDFNIQFFDFFVLKIVQLCPLGRLSEFLLAQNSHHREIRDYLFRFKTTATSNKTNISEELNRNNTIIPSGASIVSNCGDDNCSILQLLERSIAEHQERRRLLKEVLRILSARVVEEKHALSRQSEIELKWLVISLQKHCEERDLAQISESVRDLEIG